MKKVSNRVIMLVIAMAMLFAMTTVAFAVTNTGSFLISTYRGKYTATLNVSNTAASASLNISDYMGPLTGVDAVIDGQVLGVRNGLPRQIRDLYVEGMLSCSVGRDYSSEYAEGYHDIYATCKFKFRGLVLCDVTEYAPG